MLFKSLLFACYIAFPFTASAQNNAVEVINYAQLNEYLQKKNDTLYVVNFWATWCRPCVEEFPHFDSIEIDFQGEKIQVLLVSLDFKSKLGTAVVPFMVKNEVRSKVVLLYEPNADAWIRKIDENWQGSIPATLIYRGNKREFHEKPFAKKELHELIKNF